MTLKTLLWSAAALYAVVSVAGFAGLLAMVHLGRRPTPQPEPDEISTALHAQPRLGNRAGVKTRTITYRPSMGQRCKPRRFPPPRASAAR